MKTLHILLALLLMAVSARSADQAGVTGTNQPAVSITNWQRLDFRGLSFSVPPGMTNVPKRGIDSLVGECTGTNMSLTFVYGRYSSSALSEATTPIDVGGRPARIRVGPLPFDSYSNQRASGMTNNFLLAVPNDPNTLRLTIFYRNPNDLPIARAIADSVRF